LRSEEDTESVRSIGQPEKVNDIREKKKPQSKEVLKRAELQPGTDSTKPHVKSIIYGSEESQDVFLEKHRRKDDSQNKERQGRARSLRPAGVLLVLKSPGGGRGRADKQ